MLVRITSQQMPVTCSDMAYNHAVSVTELTLKASHLLRGLLADEFDEFAVSEVRYAVLRIVNAATDEGCSQKDLAAALDQSESSVSTLVDRMRDDGLLFRLRSPHDRRRRLLRLSDPGRNLLAAIEQCREQRVAKLFRGLDTKVLEQLSEGLQALVREIQRLNRVSSAA